MDMMMMVYWVFSQVRGKLASKQRKQMCALYIYCYRSMYAMLYKYLVVMIEAKVGGGVLVSNFFYLCFVGGIL